MAVMEERGPAHLAGIVALDPPGTEARGRKDEDLLCYSVDLSHALIVIDNRNPGLPNPQWYGPR